jgi:phosphoglycolate phosphatase-like HAD superfamily hydrolase
MQIRGMLIDLDLTLVDSQIAEPARRGRKWTTVYGMIPKFARYIGISELLAELRNHGIDVCVVTSSPQSYCLKVLQHFDWSHARTVCYHDTKRHKPDPEPLLSGLRLLGIQPQHAISIGDDPKDTAAAKSAGIFSVGAMWGALDREALIASKPDALCETVAELRTLIFVRGLKS